MFVSYKYLKVIVLARIKRGKTLSKGQRDLQSPIFWNKGDTKYVKKDFLWVKSQGKMPDHNESCSSQKPSLQDPSWLRGVCINAGECPRVGQVYLKETR